MTEALRSPAAQAAPVAARAASGPRAIRLVTDSPDPSGMGEHMLLLAAGLGPAATLGFPDNAAGRAFVARARAKGLAAEAVADWPGFLAGADLVHVHAGIGWEGHGLTRLAAAAGACVIRTEHLPWLLTDPAQIADYHAAARDVAAVIAVSAAAGAGWRAALAPLAAGPRLAVIPNGVPPAPRRHDGAPKGGRLLAVGRFTPQKGHLTLVAALARLRREGAPLALEILGEGEGEGLLRRAIRRFGLEEAVALPGRSGDVPARMAEADLLVSASRFEGLPLVILEAMGLGLPVVATAVTGSAEALGAEHPWCVPPRRARALAGAIAAALEDPAARAAAAARQSRRHQRHFGVERMIDRTRALYRATLRRPQPGRTTMDRIRLGFIGAGGIAHRHFGVLETMPDVAVTAIAEPDAARAEEAARRMGATAYADHEAMFAAEELDAVYICVPPFAHGPAEKACLARGLPFFVEKPLSLDIALAEEIAAEVAAQGLITAVGYHWRYLDTVDEARGLLAQNPAHLMQGFWIDQTPPPQWWWREDGSGGQIVEQATHIIDAARFLAGDVTEVFGLAARRERADFEGLTVPTATAATLRFASGAVANLAATCLLRWNHRVGLHVFSDAMAIEITDHDMMVDVGRGRPVRGAQGDPVWREDRDFVEAVMGREDRIRCPYAEALETHRVALAVARSAQTGALVKMEGLRADPQPMFRQASA